MREKPFTKQQMKLEIALGVLAWLLLVIYFVASIYGDDTRGRFDNLIIGAIFVFPPFYGFLVYQKRKDFLSDGSDDGDSK